MLSIEKIEIEDFRGVKKLALDLKHKNFGICGPNGTGKSGIVDAIEYAITGDITRLRGSGTSDLSVRAHGPHVDAAKSPNQAKVTSLPAYRHWVRRSQSKDLWAHQTLPR